MRLAPWNNPLVATALMLRARRGNLVFNSSLYIILLVMGLVGWQYFVSVSPRFEGNPHRIFLLILFGGQCLLSSIIMLSQAGNAIKNEVMNKTLDFQRIASVSSWDILIGKLLGPPVMAYLLALSAIPIAVFTLLNGVPGVGMVELLLSWVQLLTFLFLLGSCVIQNTLQVSSNKSTGVAPGFGILLAVLGLIIYSTFAGGDSKTYLADPRRSTLAALLTPLTAFAGLSAQDPWSATFPWLSWEIPCLLFTPVAHLVIAWFVLSIMARRIANVESTPLGKKKGYLFLLLADLVLAGVIVGCGPLGKLGAAGLNLQQQLSAFLIIHLLLTMVYYISLSPRADWVRSWVWRYRKPGKDMLHSLLHDRAPNSMAILVNLTSAALAGGLILLQAQEPVQISSANVNAGLAALVLVAVLGAVYQAVQLISQKFALAYFLLFLMFLLAAPVMFGAMLCSMQIPIYVLAGQILLHATPLTQLIHLLVDANGPYPMLFLHLFLTVIALVFTWKRVARMHQRVAKIKTLLMNPAAMAAAT
ncbi:MAG TPA: hypothetical protein PKA06_07715 [Gemmatales bacterium]|nr:hypothetical protein [Gemmatales bacterium]